jgi:hypothetical protein
MWNSRMEIDGGGDSIVATSLLDASNLIVLKVSCWSNINYCFYLLVSVCISISHMFPGIICDTL